MDEFRREREWMVDAQIAARGVRNERVLDAMRFVPRHEFVPTEDQWRAYDDTPIPIGFGQTISQPLIVAWETELLEPRPADRILEIGTGCGYSAAVLSKVVHDVYSIEIVAALFEKLKTRLDRYPNIHLRWGDGHAGWPEAAPFDGIVLTAAPEEVPQTLFEQLKPQRYLVAPVGPADAQQLVRYRKQPDGTVLAENVGAVAFVPMTKKQD